jgi:hypothetical protein
MCRKITQAGFVSICAPCTRAISEDEDIRAEDGGGVESQRGLHQKSC